MSADTAGIAVLPPDPDLGLRDFHRRWPTIKPPLRPTADVAAAIGVLLVEAGIEDDPVLLLGVTPELATIPRRVIAIDWSADMIRVAWPGDDDGRRVVIGDWKQMPLAACSVAAAIGDGVLTMLSYPAEQPLLFEQLRRVVRPGGRIVLRCFATPEPCEELEAIRTAALAGALPFHAFKQRFNMAVCAAGKRHNIASAQLFDQFVALFPDRAALARASGWSIATIAEMDAYRASRYIHCYPSRTGILAVVPTWARNVRFVETDGYPLAERCPLLVFDLP